MKIREELEILINESPLFLINYADNVELFVTEERRLLNDIAKLMQIIRKDFNEIGLEIICTAKACIKAYKAEHGVFLNYFNTSLKKTLYVTKGKKVANDRRGGITISEKTEQTIRKVIKYAEKRNKDIYNQDFQSNIAETLNITILEVQDAITINDNATILSGNDKISNRDGSENNLFEYIAVSTKTPEEALVNASSAREIAVLINTAFRKQQERTKPLLSKLLTARLIDEIDEPQFLKEIMQDLTFVDEDIYSGYFTHGKIPMMREIASIYRTKEASASRMLNTFLRKISKEMLNKQ
ncbi:MAG: hypothetical protein LBH05_02170 [Deferribacteraceae bacterium]|jgi:DNA-directed RNA polymerase specialized sigma subunit|nr:hypothetical protein [Deferribacteraceae bacterium]